VKFNHAQLKCFVTLFETRSFSDSAEVLGVTASAVHQNIKSLHKLLDENLYASSRSGIQFTPYGKAFYKEACKAIEAFESLEAWAFQQKGSPSVKVQLICQNMDIHDITLLPFIPEFREAHPNIDLEVNITDNVVNVVRQSTDIYWGFSSYIGETDEGLVSKNLIKFTYGVFASPEYLKQNGIPESISDLKDHFLIGNTKNEPSDGLFLKILNKRKAELNSITMQAPITATYSIEELGAKGLGIFNASPNMPKVRKKIESGEILPILENAWYKNIMLKAYYQSTRYNQLGVRQVIDFFYSKRKLWDA
jgi:DNA-binding transcriptional LysR family regulator